MFLDSTTNQLHPLYVASQSTALRSRPQPSPTGKEGPEPPASSLLSPPGNPMERGAPEYSQSGLPSPLPSNVGDSQSEASSADHVSAAPFASQQEARSATYSASATPTSEYSVFPPSARSAAFPEHIQRSYHPANNHGGGGGGMAQTPTSPSVPLSDDGQTHHSQVKSDNQLPLDPSIAAPNPTYPHGQYATYATPGQEMTTHGYTHPGSAGLYAQPRPDWSGYGQSPGGPIAPGHHVFPQTPTNAAPAARQNQVGFSTCAAVGIFASLPSPMRRNSAEGGAIEFIRVGGRPGIPDAPITSYPRGRMDVCFSIGTRQLGGRFWECFLSLPAPRSCPLLPGSKGGPADTVLV